MQRLVRTVFPPILSFYAYGRPWEVAATNAEARPKRLSTVSVFVSSILGVGATSHGRPLNGLNWP